MRHVPNERNLHSKLRGIRKIMLYSCLMLINHEQNRTVLAVASMGVALHYTVIGRFILLLVYYLTHSMTTPPLQSHCSRQKYQTFKKLLFIL